MTQWPPPPPVRICSGSRERRRHSLLVRGPEPPAHQEGGHEYEHEVDEQQHGGVDDLVQVGRDARALRGEQHDDREEQRHEREHADARSELVEVPGGSLGLGECQAHLWPAEQASQSDAAQRLWLACSRPEA
ncbi:hypothetical protein ON010_g14312 [Phytophthora cinnamomi]|nr:hypothetical protein ON010_g14312 [Phytophthora cinnamomi]